MTLDENHPFEAALKSLRDKKLFPTTLDTAAIRQQLGATFHAQNFTSAQNNLVTTLDAFKSRIDSLLDPQIEQRADRVTPENPQGNVTTGLNEAKAREQMKEAFRLAGYSPNPDDAGTLKDLSGDARINLVLRTNKQLAQGEGWWLQGQNAAVLEQFPAQELFRAEARAKERDWLSRWRLAGAQTGDPIGTGWTITPDGRLIALKDHDIWNWIGSSELFPDALDVIWPPFAFNSGMWVSDVDRDEAEEIGLMDKGDAAPKPTNIISALKAFTEKISALAA
ncbi:MAG TPA: hypothetical protein VHY30_01555 [Verrucomicrobiae bacterium]|jgi:hypothetical protein|nr:hypothetical protein [Verrucomicrobiae bacterium]